MKTRKNFGAHAHIYPQPVFIIASYDENGTPDAMNAAWGNIADYTTIALYLAPSHKTVENILNRKAFTVSMATEDYMLESDYVGIVSANNVPDKLERSGFHTTKSEFVDAPLIDELPMTLECELISYDTNTDLLLGKVINLSADESILDETGKIDPFKLKPIIFDSVHASYLNIGNKVGNAFNDGNKINNK